MQDGFAKGLGRKLLAEFLGTFWLVLGGCGSAVIFSRLSATRHRLSRRRAGLRPYGADRRFLFGPVSGVDFNPAVSLGLAAAGRFSWKELGPYWVAQLVGATFAAFILLLVAKGDIDFSLAGGFAANGYEDHSPAGYTLQAGFIIETC